MTDLMVRRSISLFHRARYKFAKSSLLYSFGSSNVVTISIEHVSMPPFSNPLLVGSVLELSTDNTRDGGEELFG